MQSEAGILCIRVRKDLKFDNMSNPLISVVSPVYKSEKIVAELVLQLKNSLTTITDDFEIVLVCDGSPDNSWNEILKCCVEDKRVVGINLSRNFGQHPALSAGLKYAKGECVVVIDCDLQDNPTEIIRMYELKNQGYDIVHTRRIKRKDGLMKRLSSKVFNAVYTFLSGMKVDGSVPNFCMLSKKVVEEFNKMGEISRSFQSLTSYLGFKTITIDTEHQNRYEGKSSYSIMKLLKLSEDVIISNSNRPLRIGITIGAIMTLLSLVLVFYNTVLYLTKSVVPGFSSTIISIWFVGGAIMMMLGISGLYIDRIFNQVKNRQLYIVDEVINGEKI